MESQIKLGRIFGIEIGLHYSWFIIAVLIAVSLAQSFRQTNRDWSEQVVWSAAILTAILFFACLLAHELSHSLVARARHLPVRRITLFALGGVSVIEKESPNAWTEFLVAIVGPLTSIVIGAGLTLLAATTGHALDHPPAGPGMAILLWLGYINLALGIFNLVPGFPLDGGRVLRSIVWGVTRNMERATFIATRVGQAIAIAFILWGIYRAFSGAGIGGLWLAFIGWFLLQSAGANYLQLEMKHVLQDLHARDLMTRDCVLVDPHMSVQNFVDEIMLRSAMRCFIVAQNGTLLGMLTSHEVRAVPRERWPATSMQEIMKPLEKVRFVSPETPLADALEVMAREDLNQLPVISQQQFHGVLTRSSVLQVLKARMEMQHRRAA